MEDVENISDPWRLIHKQWMQKEGIPVYEASTAVEDITELPRRPWARMGGSGTFIQLDATEQAGKMLYLAEIPPGQVLNPEKHLYDELLYIMRGRGLTEVWNEGERKNTFEWGEGSLFAMPNNAWHRLVNGGREPVLIFGQSNAPVIMDTFRDTEFVFNCDYKFTDRYTGQADYFAASEKRYKEGILSRWETNFIPDVRKVNLDDFSEKVAGGQITFFKMASWTKVHSSEWPVGRYHKAHWHGAGATLLGLKSVGYVLLWPKQYGIHPYQDGYGDKVVKAAWKPGSIYSPCDGWFHQHFNTGREPARHLAAPGGGDVFGRPLTHGMSSIREEGGRIIEYEDEDPEIRRMFKEDLRQKGIELAMPPVVYRTDPFEIHF